MSNLRILLLSGGTYHDFDGFEEAIRPLLESAGHTLDATYDLDTLLALEKPGHYHLVINNTCLGKRRPDHDDTHQERLTNAQTEALVAFVRAGGGYLPFHSATVSGEPNPELARLNGALFLEHPPLHTFTVYPTRLEHPITTGIEAFCVRDELYMQAYHEDVIVLMVAIDRGVAYPMVWTRHEGQGRVAHIALGHTPEVWHSAPFQKLFMQTVDWLTPGRRHAPEVIYL